MSAKLLREILLPALQNPVLDRLDDQAIVDVGGSRIAFSTDTFVVKPLFFPGGDIGTLAVNGTVNDLAMGGAKPLFLSLALILEEGLPIDTLRRVMESIGVASALGGRCRRHGRHEGSRKRERRWIVCEYLGNRSGPIRRAAFG